MPEPGEGRSDGPIFQTIAEAARPRRPDWGAVAYLRERPIEIVTGVLVVFGGIIVSLAFEGRWAPVLGTVFSTAGGFLLSWSVAGVQTRRRAVEVLRPELESARQHLGTVAGQIVRAVDAVQSEEYGPETGMAMIKQSANTLHVIVSDLKQLTGSGFDPESVLETISRIQEYVARSDAQPGAGEEDEEEEEASTPAIADPGLQQRILSDLQELRASVERTSGSTASGVRHERAKCPSCGQEGLFSLGVAIGSTRAHQCGACHQTFNMHRLRSTVLLRPTGALAASPYADQSIAEAEIRKNKLWIDTRLPLDEILRLIATIVAGSANGRVPSFIAIEAAATEELRRRHGGIDVATIESDVRKARQLAFRLWLFKLYGMESGVGLADGVTPDTIVECAQRTVVARLVNIHADKIQAPDVAKALFGSTGPDAVRQAETLLQKVTSRQIVTPPPSPDGELDQPPP